MPIDMRPIKNVASVFGRLRREYVKSQVRAVNKTQVTIRKVAQQKIREFIPLKAAWVRNAIVLQKAKQRPRMALQVRMKGIPVRLKGPTSIKDPWYRARRLKSGLIKAKVTTSRPVPFKRSFAHDHVRGTPVLARKGRSRYPLKRRFGPSIIDIFTKFQVQRVMNIAWRDRLPVELGREEQRMLDKHWKIQ